MHLVHKSEAGTLAVVGVLIESGSENAEFTPIWHLLPPSHGESQHIGGNSIYENTNGAALGEFKFFETMGDRIYVRLGEHNSYCGTSAHSHLNAQFVFAPAACHRRW